LVTALALTCAGALAACGAAYTKQDYIARADAICASAVRDARAVPPPVLTGTGSQQLAGLAQYLTTVLPIYESEARQLRGLKLPQETSSSKVALQRFLAALSAATAELRGLARAARGKDAQGVAVAEAGLRANTADPLAASYGFKSCGTPGATVE